MQHKHMGAHSSWVGVGKSLFLCFLRVSGSTRSCSSTKQIRVICLWGGREECILAPIFLSKLSKPLQSWYSSLKDHYSCYRVGCRVIVPTQGILLGVWKWQQLVLVLNVLKLTQTRKVSSTPFKGRYLPCNLSKGKESGVMGSIK